MNVGGSIFAFAAIFCAAGVAVGLIWLLVSVFAKKGKKIPALVSVCSFVLFFILVGLGMTIFPNAPEGVLQEEYDRIIAERDKWKNDYNDLQEEYAKHLAEDTAGEINNKYRQPGIENNDFSNENSSDIAQGQNNSKFENILYEDGNVKIAFAGISSKGVEFWVENLTDLNITIQADTVSVNKISISNIMMSDDVAPKSIGKVVAKCDDFSVSTTVETVGGQLRVVDFSKTWEPYYYDVTFVNVSVK